MRLTNQAPERIDWAAVRDMINLAEVIARELGPAPGRRGARRSRPWWACPFHEDRNPSLTIIKGGKGFKCYGCGESGDAVAFVRRLNPKMAFPEAVRYLVGGPASSGRSRSRSRPQPRPRPESEPRPEGMTETDALALVEAVAGRLWTPEKADALAYLMGPSRLLRPETIRAARLGWTPLADGVPWRPPGVVIPWFRGGRLALVKVRPPDAWREGFPKDKRPPKYIEAYRCPQRLPRLYPGPEAIRPGRPLIITEGEFDALLLGQALGELAAVVTLGSASARPDPGILGAMLFAFPWYVATDADDAGDMAVTGWPAPVRRVRPPGSYKDWTEAAADGLDLCRWWREILGGNPAPPLFTWDDLATWSWGPADDDPMNGIVIDQPDRERMQAALQADEADPDGDGSGLLGALLTRLAARGVCLDGGPVHPRVAVGTVTGRVLYTEPALQILPKAERLDRISPIVQGRRFVRADFGQIEPRILLAILRRRGLIAWDIDPDEDLYRVLAGEAIGRDAAKVLVNKVINGGRPDPGAQGRLAEFIAAADSFRGELAAEAQAAGRVRTLAGSEIPLDADEGNHSGKAVNRVVQGTAADIFNRAAVAVSRALDGRGLPAAVAFLLFDELWVEADPCAVAAVEDLIRAEMEAAALADGMAVPVRLDT